MAAANLIAVGSDAASSADQTIADTPLTVALKGDADSAIPNDAVVEIQAKDDASLYWTVGKLTAATPSAVISGPGTYRLHRPTQREPVGAFSA